MKIAKRVRVPLTTLIDCRREAARLYRMGLSGALPVESCRALASVLRVVGAFIVDSTIEQRIEQLEKKTE